MTQVPLSLSAIPEPPPGGGLGETAPLSNSNGHRGEPAESLLVSGESADNATILIVDDEPINIKVVQKYLRETGYDNFVTTSDSRRALDLIRHEHPDVVVLDIMMPHVNGLQILEVVRGDRQLHHLPVLVLSAASDDETRLKALELGATDFLNKPVQPAELTLRIRNALILKAHHDHLAKYSARLENEVRLRTAEMARSREEVIHVLARAAEHRDHETGNHVLRVGCYAGVIARQMGISDSRAELIEHASALHDVGKIGIPDAILLKPGKLTFQEMEVMRKHCEYGRNILSGGVAPAELDAPRSGVPPRFCESPILELSAKIAMSHHEKWDGSGYPKRLSGEAIPIEGRITGVADVFDALISRRPYKKALPMDRCFEILEEGRGSHFDPQVLDAFFSRVDDIVRITSDLPDGACENPSAK